MTPQPPPMAPPTAQEGAGGFPRPRWGLQTSFVQIEQPAFWLFVLALVPTLLLFVLEQAAFAELQPAAWAFSWFLLAFYALPVFVAVYLADTYEREPVSMLVAALLWGGIVAIGFSGLANTFWGAFIVTVRGHEFAAEWSAALTAPFVEETYKFLGLVVLALVARAEIDDLMDGFVYGAMIGLGFTVVEDVSYFVAGFATELSGEVGGELPAVLVGFYLRVVASGLYGHVVYTGLAGIGLAYALTAQAGRGRRVAVAAVALALAVGGHFLWNSPLLDFFPEWPWHGTDWLQVLVASAVKGLPLALFVALLVVIARRRERRGLGAALRLEVGLGGLTATELDVLARAFGPRRARKRIRSAAGRDAARLFRQLQREQVRLAMIRTRVERDDDPELVRHRGLCWALRERLLAMPGVRGVAPYDDAAGTASRTRDTGSTARSS